MKVDAHDIRFFTAFDGSVGAMISLGDRIAIGRHAITTYAPGNEWKTDEDRFGIVLLEPYAGSLRLRVHEIPMVFGIRATGANGAKRSFDVEQHVDGGLVCSLTSPFSDARGWGKEIFLFYFDLQTEVWERLVLDKQGRAVRAPLGDRAEPPELCVGGGEPRITIGPAGEVLLALDVTPYHLEDAERAITNAVDLGLRAARAGQRYSSGAGLTWTLHSPQGPALDLESFDAYARARPELADAKVERTFALRGASLQVGVKSYIAVAGRAFVDGPYRDFLAVVPAPR